MPSGRNTGVRRRCDHSGRLSSRARTTATPSTINPVLPGEVAATATGQTRLITTTPQAMPRWNRAASDAGHESTARWTSRPEDDVVQVCLTGHALQTVGVPR